MKNKENQMRTIIDIHILQTVPPSNINRDDTGSPKTAYYGGSRRARVSSQAWKKATRDEMAIFIDDADVSFRTKKVVELVLDEIISQDPDCEDAEKRAENILKFAGIKISKGKDKDYPHLISQYLMFISKAQATRLAELALDDESEAKEIRKAARYTMQNEQGIAIALFGRMVADDKSLNVDASCQVAHAISVDTVTPQFDYFTAVDDLNADDEAGAGMIGTVEFNSSTLYRYATLDVNALEKTLGNDVATAKAAAAFVQAFVRSMPTGKQNTFANRTLPEGVVVMVRENQPVNLVQAFEEAVYDQEGKGCVREASKRLVDEAEEVTESYGGAPVKTYVVAKGKFAEPLTQLGTKLPLDELAKQLETLLQERLGADENE